MSISITLTNLKENTPYAFVIMNTGDDSFRRVASFTTARNQTTRTLVFNDDLADVATSYKCNNQTFLRNVEFTPNITLINTKGVSLTIAYNPELTSLKSNHIDTITPTLGSAYPVVRRNGHQKYRTFSIGGMFAADENVDFDLVVPAGLDEYAAAAYRERLFKEEALKFLYAEEPWRG